MPVMGRVYRSAMTDAPLFSFGVIADPQYADLPPNLQHGRYYASSLGKLREAVDRFNGEELAFVAVLGDLIDRDHRHYAVVLPILDTLRHGRIMLPGNHDFSVEVDFLPHVHATLGMEAPWYARTVHGMRFIVLDGSHVSTFAPPPGDARREIAAARLAGLQAANAINANEWNGTLGEEQFRWLKEQLDTAEQGGERVIVMCHYPVYPENNHNLWDAPRVLDLLGGYRCVAAWFNGHNHDGNFGVLDGKYYVNFKGMVDTEDRNTFAIVDVYTDRIDIRGFGREDSRTLPLQRL